MKKYYVNKHSEVFEYIGPINHLEHSPDAVKPIFHKYPAVILKHVITGEYTTILNTFLEMEFSEFYSDLVIASPEIAFQCALENLKKFRETDDWDDLKGPQVKLAAKACVENYLSSFYGEREVHPDFKKTLEHFAITFVINFFIMKKIKNEKDQKETVG